MATKPSSIFLIFLFFSTLTISSSGSLVGFSYNARGDISAASSSPTISFLKENKNVSSTQICVFVADQRVLNLTSLSNSTVSVDLYLNLSLVADLMQSDISAVSWLETNVLANSHPHAKIKNIMLSCRSEEFDGKNVFPMIFSALKLFNSVLDRIHLGMKVKVSVAFPLPLLENLNPSHKGEIRNILGFIRKTESFVIIEAGVDQQLSLEDLLLQSLIKKVIKATSVFPASDFLIALVMKSPLFPNARDLAEFTENMWKYFEDIEIGDRVDEFYSEVSSLGEKVFSGDRVDEFYEGLSSLGEKIFPGDRIDEFYAEVSSLGEKIFPSSSRRELVNRLKTTIRETFNPVNPPTTGFPPENNPTPIIVTVPSTNPVTITPNPENSSPLPIPSTTPVNIPPATPVNPAAPVTVPGVQPVTNPVTTFQPPAAGNVPSTNPVTAPPATTNAPAIPGQTWCVAKTGVSETSLQAALDYACGTGGADCSVIQQGGNCYNPNSLQNHASYAFNSYYQKSPLPSSCDFGGTAMIVSTNPSTGSCVYPTSSSSSTGTIPPAQPNSTTPPETPTTASPPAGPGISGSVTPPTVLNSSNPASIFGADSPPFVNTSTSTSDGSALGISWITFVTLLIIGIIMPQGQN